MPSDVLINGTNLAVFINTFFTVGPAANQRSKFDIMRKAHAHSG